MRGDRGKRLTLDVDKLHSLQEQQRLSTAKLARKAGVGVNTLHNFKGLWTAPVHERTLNKLARALEVAPNELLKTE